MSAADRCAYFHPSKTRFSQQRSERSDSKNVQMPWRIQMKPGRTTVSVPRGVYIWCYQGKAPARFKNATTFPKQTQRLVDVLDYVTHRYGSERIPWVSHVL